MPEDKKDLSESKGAQSVRLCPYCYVKDSKLPRHYLEYDENRPRVVICDVHGEIPLGHPDLKNCPQAYFTHYEDEEGIHYA